jgi:hypothetical protein
MSSKSFVGAYSNDAASQDIPTFPELELDSYAGMSKLKRGEKFHWLYEQWRRLQLVESLPGLTPEVRQFFGQKFQETKHHEHQAAIVCILTGLLVIRNQFVAVGDAQGGWFFLPPWSCWKRWAQDTVCSNLGQLHDAQVQLVHDGRSVSLE